MLTVYTRHSQKCPHKDDIAWRRCRCPKWIQGTPSEDHEFMRTSAATRTWEQAEEKARKLEEEARPGARKTAPAITIAEAVAAYRADETARCLSKSTTNQSKTLFQFHLLAWANSSRAAGFLLVCPLPALRLSGQPPKTISNSRLANGLAMVVFVSLSGKEKSGVGSEVLLMPHGLLKSLTAMRLIEILENRREALKVAEVAKMLGVTPPHIYKMAKAGLIPCFHVKGAVRFCPAELAEWIKQEIEQANRKRNGSNGGTSMKYGT